MIHRGRGNLKGGELGQLAERWVSDRMDLFSPALGFHVKMPLFSELQALGGMEFFSYYVFHPGWIKRPLSTWGFIHLYDLKHCAVLLCWSLAIIALRIKTLSSLGFHSLVWGSIQRRQRTGIHGQRGALKTSEVYSGRTDNRMNEQGMTAVFKFVSGCHKEQKIILFCVTPESRAVIDEGDIMGRLISAPYIRRCSRK